jgi:hypothetical protein
MRERRFLMTGLPCLSTNPSTARSIHYSTHIGHERITYHTYCPVPQPFIFHQLYFTFSQRQRPDENVLASHWGTIVRCLVGVIPGGPGIHRKRAVASYGGRPVKLRKISVTCIHSSWDPVYAVSVSVISRNFLSIN